MASLMNYPVENSKERKIEITSNPFAKTLEAASVSLIFIINYYSGVLHIGIEIKPHRDYFFILGC